MIMYIDTAYCKLYKCIHACMLPVPDILVFTSDLSNNEIQSIRPETFIGQAQLKTLILSDNEMDTLEPGTLAPLKNLVTL